MKNRGSANAIMLNVVLAAAPAVFWSVYVFGFRCLTIYAVSVISSVLCQFVAGLAVNRGKVSIDLSSVVTGLLVGMAMPVSVPLWLPAAASAFAAAVGKMFFGGTGRNLFNPAASGICFAYLVFADRMTAFTKPFVAFSPVDIDVSGELLDTSRALTAADQIRAGVTDTGSIAEELYGLAPGSIGTVSALLLAVGLIYLLLTRTVHFNSFAAFILVYMLLSVLLCYIDYEPTQFMELQLVSGPLMFILVFMLNDYTTAPTTSLGRIAFAVIAAVAVYAVRWMGMVHYGEYFVVLLMNALSPIIEMHTYPAVFGSKVRDRI